MNLDAALESLPEDPIEAAEALLKEILGRTAGASKDSLYEALGTYEAFAKANNLGINAYSPTDWSPAQLEHYFVNERAR